MIQQPIIGALWIGNHLNPIAHACLQSFLKCGHTVHLYTYDEIDNIPAGITVCDGNQIIDHSKIIKHKKSGSFALFSDIFRYELLKKTANIIYVDCDVYCLKPVFIPEHGYLYGYESASYINGAVLALPKDSPLLNILSNLGQSSNFVPEWYSTYNKLRLKIKRLFGYAKDITEMGWGVIGPSAITHYANKLNVANLAQAPEVFYPIHHEQTHKLLDENIKIDDIISDDTLCVHLYNETLRSVDLSKIAQNSILAQMLRGEV
ncbi:galactosyltransferase Lgt5 [Moraxella marmotae]|uniref:galactosyltransferase Lgt5 n=1 Tax=Moraxella marmotae TaxID=3344520 RepID=UPI0035F3C4E1